jgi:hypothetical protein
MVDALRTNPASATIRRWISGGTHLASVPVRREKLSTQWLRRPKPAASPPSGSASTSSRHNPVGRPRAGTLGGHAVGIIGSGHRLDRGRRERLGSIGRQLARIVRYWFERVDRRVAVRVGAGLHHESVDHDRSTAGHSAESTRKVWAVRLERSESLRSTQNSFPSGSASTTQPLPSSARRSSTKLAPS